MLTFLDMLRYWLVAAVLNIAAQAIAAPNKQSPSVDALLSLQQLWQDTAMSADGKRVAYTIHFPDLDHDTGTDQIWVAEADGTAPKKVGCAAKSCFRPIWSPDGRSLAYLSDGQIHLVSPAGGVPTQVTNAKSAVQNFSWSPDGTTIAFTSTSGSSGQSKSMYTVVGAQARTPVSIFSIDVASARNHALPGTAYPIGDLTVGSFAWAPDSGSIAFTGSRLDDIADRASNDIYVLSVANNRIRKIVGQPGFDQDPIWSPDGQEILFTTAMGRSGLNTYTFEVATVAVSGGAPRLLTGDFDGHPRALAWNRNGIFFWANQKTATHLYRLYPKSLSIVRVSTTDDFSGAGFSFSADGSAVAFVAGSATSLFELYTSRVEHFAPTKLTDMSAQIRDLDISPPEVISWRNPEGTIIEGVLNRPIHFDPGRKYPLLVALHGGPSDRDVPLVAFRSTVYPPEVWASRGAFVLRVNYRGSSGYGSDFQKASYRNLGAAESSDILSGIDYLIAGKAVDPAKVGCMGWSHGGFLCAYLAFTTRRFAAVSVGAGVADFASMYYNGSTYLLDYFGAKPFEDPEVYRKSSPLTYVRGAHTPTLIQHGDRDQNVKVEAAYQLRRALVDQGIAVELIIYRDSGHNITRPRTLRAAAVHNLQWFGHYLWGDPKPDFSEH